MAQVLIPNHVPNDDDDPDYNSDESTELLTAHAEVHFRNRAAAISGLFILSCCILTCATSFALASSEWLRSLLPAFGTICLGLGVLAILLVFVRVLYNYKKRPQDEFAELLTGKRRP